MRIIYKRSLALIAFLIAICGFIGVAYLFYDKVIVGVETEVVVLENLSVNFLNGNVINSNGTYEFSVTNNGSREIYFSILTDELSGFDNDLSYDLVSSEASVNLVNVNLDNDNNVIEENILIKPGVTQNYKFTVSNNTITNFKLIIKINKDVVEYFYATILKNNKVKEKAITNLGEVSATSNEGLIEDVDDYGLTYYFRGNVENNYVMFANLMWRIVRINGDGTVKLVLDTITDDLIEFNDNIENYEDFQNTNINKTLLSYYDHYLSSFDTYVAKAKFCQEIEYTANENEKIYNSYSRLIVNKIPTFNCLGEKYSGKIGLMTADEVVFAGANFSDENNVYYLFNEEIENVWWTSTLAKASDSSFYPFVVTEKGIVNDETSGNLYRGLRPVININKKVVVNGKGTQDEPYEIK